MLKTLKYSPTAEEKYQDCIERELNCKHLKMHGDIVEYFDNNGNKIIQQIKDMKGNIWFISISDYDSKNRLIKKRVSDIISTFKIEYVYNLENEKPKELYFDNRGNKINPRISY